MMTKSKLAVQVVMCEFAITDTQFLDYRDRKDATIRAN